jgi:2'-5' RNA ligase
LSEERWRLFVAAPLGEEPAAQLWRALSELRQRRNEARWLAPELYHATLVFLGSTPAETADALAGAMRDVASHWPPFSVTLHGSGGRAGGRRGGVAWLKVSEGGAQLVELSLAIDRALASDVYLASAPRPHVTVARRADEPLLHDLARTAAELRLRWPVDRVVLYRSHSGPQGSRYEELATARLIS